mgnify:CR=1 FL=1|tara:strand:- start:135 stop:1262 length:1128 start_codon:yes stop_codon:yes gene_type:complete
MQVDGQSYRTVWMGGDGISVEIIDQRKLPWSFEVVTLRSTDDAAHAIFEMLVRGAGCIGATAAHGMFLAARECADAASPAEFDRNFEQKGEQLCSTRPTAMNLAWAVDRQLVGVRECSTIEEKVAAAHAIAIEVADEDAEWCQKIGQYGLPLIRNLFEKKGGSEPVNILTHCNAGWLAFVDYGSATAPIYAAHDAGIPVHVWVDETRPRNQGARLTAWELGKHGVPHTVIVDNVGGHLMQHDMVDMVITGTDRTTVTGDVANKIGTYLKALAAEDNEVPFYVALPSSTFDWETRDGVNEIPIEQRDGREVTHLGGWNGDDIEPAGEVEVNLVAESSPVANYAFDVTPARLITGLITERGVCEAKESDIRALFPEK